MIQKVNVQFRWLDSRAFGEWISFHNASHIVDRPKHHTWSHTKALFNPFLNLRSDTRQIIRAASKQDVAALHVSLHVAELQRLVQSLEIRHLDDGVTADIHRAKERNYDRHGRQYTSTTGNPETA